MHGFKKFSVYKMETMIQEDPELADNKLNDNNNIVYLIKINYGLKTLKLVIMILSAAYFIGMIWIIICTINYEISIT